MQIAVPFGCSAYPEVLCNEEGGGRPLRHDRNYQSKEHQKLTRKPRTGCDNDSKRLAVQRDNCWTNHLRVHTRTTAASVYAQQNTECTDLSLSLSLTLFRGVNEKSWSSDKGGTTATTTPDADSGEYDNDDDEINSNNNKPQNKIIYKNDCRTFFSYLRFCLVDALPMWLYGWLLM